VLWSNYEMLVLLFGCETVAAAGRTVARPVALAQARLSRPGETCRSRPGLHSNSCSSGKLLFWVRHYLAQARDSRLSENVWGPWCATAILAQAKGGLAQAREVMSSNFCPNLIFKFGDLIEFSVLKDW